MVLTSAQPAYCRDMLIHDESYIRPITLRVILRVENPG
jgi:hypothetical protein